MNSQSALSTSSLTLSLVRRGVGRGRCGRGGIVRKHTYVKCSKYYHGRHCRGHCFTENTDAASIQPAPSSSTATHAGPPVAAVSVGVCVRISDTCIQSYGTYVHIHGYISRVCACIRRGIQERVQRGVRARAFASVQLLSRAEQDMSDLWHTPPSSCSTARGVRRAAAQCSASAERQESLPSSCNNADGAGPVCERGENLVPADAGGTGPRHHQFGRRERKDRALHGDPKHPCAPEGGQVCGEVGGGEGGGGRVVNGESRAVRKVR
jgi:hypothetical protein